MEWHAKSLKSPLQNLFFAPKIAESTRRPKFLFAIGIWKSLVILGYLLPVEIHSCPKGKHIFFGRGIHGPRKIHLQQSHLQQPLLRQGVRGKFLGQNPLVERWFPNNVELSRWESSCHPVVSSLSRIVTMSEITWKMALSTKAKDTCLCSKHDLLEEE